MTQTIEHTGPSARLTGQVSHGTLSCVGADLDRTEKRKESAFPFLHVSHFLCLEDIFTLLPAASSPSEAHRQGPVDLLPSP